MTFIETIAEDEATGAVAAMYETNEQTMGYLPNYTRAFSLRPEVCSVLLDKFLDPDQVRAVVNDYHNAGLEPVDLAVMELAEKVADDATSVTAGDIERLRGLGLTDAEILDVVLATAVRCFFSKTLDAVGVQPDSRYGALEPELRQTLTVGRPIAED